MIEAFGVSNEISISNHDFVVNGVWGEEDVDMKCIKSKGRKYLD